MPYMRKASCLATNFAAANLRDAYFHSGTLSGMPCSVSLALYFGEGPNLLSNGWLSWHKNTNSTIP